MGGQGRPREYIVWEARERTRENSKKGQVGEGRIKGMANLLDMAPLFFYLYVHLWDYVNGRLSDIGTGVK
jgi:hypothetical protein